MSGETYVVYQMGKVGSSTAYESLRAAGVEPLHKIHYLSAAGLAGAQRRYREYEVSVPVPYEATSVELQRRIRDEPDRRWKVITLVREPIARDVSAYVQMVDLLHPRLVAGGEPDVPRLARLAGVQFAGFDEGTSYTCRWFDDELHDALGVDVYAEPFDWDRGWERVARGNVDVLVLRLEDAGWSWERALTEFTGRPVPLTRHSSRSPAKLQAAYVEHIYGRIVDRVVVSQALARRVYASRYARHFYRDAEIERFVARWSSLEGRRPKEESA